uniref:Uncharacterized protein n=1 Tax=Arundo donax TaxID=35708 RepID=A0A0A9EL42_ARUDO
MACLGENHGLQRHGKLMDARTAFLACARAAVRVMEANRWTVKKLDANG